MERRVISRMLRHPLAWCLVAAAVLCLAGTTASAADAKYNWKFANPLTLPHVDVLLQKFCDNVAEYSKGQIAVRYYPNGQLGTHDESFHGVQEGSIQLAMVQPYVHLVPGAMIAWTPWTISSWKEFALAFELDNGSKGPLAKLMEAALDEVGLRPLFYRSYGGLGLANSVREIKTPDDFKDLKFRVSGSLGFVRALANMCLGSGATFETMPMGEAYNALSKGVVNALWDSWLEMLNLRHGEVVKYFTVLDWAWDVSAISVNKELWEELPDDLKQAVTRAAEEMQTELAAVEEKAEAGTRAKIESQFPDMKITTVTDAQRDVFREKANMAAVWAELCTPWLEKAYPGQNMTEKTLKAIDEVRAQARK